MKNKILVVFKRIAIEVSKENNCSATYFSSYYITPLYHFGVLGACVNLNMEMK